MKKAHSMTSKRVALVALCWLMALSMVSAPAAAMAGAAPSFPAIIGYPNSIASTGDSITRAFNTGVIPFTDAPANSWSTGQSSAVDSHYSRILAANPAIGGNTYNDAVTGSQMNALSGQVQQAISQNAAYVTILLGGNDACTDTVSSMTPVSTYASEFQTAMNSLTQELPDARIYVVSIPNVYNLWVVLHNNFWARLTWSTLSICQSLLANPGSTSRKDQQRRLQVQAQVQAYNQQLQTICAQYIHCRFDNNAVYHTNFTAGDINTRDYFHPNLTGQALLASVSWEATYNFADNTAPTTTTSTSPAPGGLNVTLTATDGDDSVAGIEYFINALPWIRYTNTVFVPSGSTMTYRAVDSNGNIEASHSITAP